MSKKGKVLEQLVKTIEEQIKGDSTLRVRSNVKIKNTTGIPREFDVVIDHDTEDSLMTVIECKEHKNRLDIQYIDAFFGKCSSFNNISRMIMVSSSGFTKNAIAEANGKGIELHTVSDIKDTEDAPKYDVAIGTLRCEKLSNILVFTVEGQSELYVIEWDSIKEIKTNNGDDLYEVFSNKLSEELVMPEKQLLEALHKYQTDHFDILSFVEEPLTVVTDSEEIHVLSLGYCIHVESHFIPQDMTTQRQYGNPDTVISEFELKGTGIKTSLIRSSDSMKMYFNDDPYLEPLEDM